jgi:hypothetical protein
MSEDSEGGHRSPYLNRLLSPKNEREAPGFRHGDERDWRF